SIALVSANVIVFLICSMTKDVLYDAGCCGIFETVMKQEYWRIFTATFLHVDLEHLFNNMLLLGFMGAMLEKIIGHLPFTVVYVLSGIAGNVLSLCVKWYQNDWAVSLGASGAVFGLDGLLLAIVLILQDRVQDIPLSRVVIMIALSLYSGFSSSNVDNAGHVGGLIAGFLVSALICMVKRWKGTKERSKYEY
ncbi:MAG: rhomboid family intramembrane serine protease, partial [Lachnospiraceae bacterium]|nr:rhomboid family intramembrane serine protease [Lachnospiraceae bacterium]